MMMMVMFSKSFVGACLAHAHVPSDHDRDRGLILDEPSQWGLGAPHHRHYHP
jgi:hypothetical protein